MKTLVCFLIALSLIIPATALARTWLINATGTGDAPNIQAGVDSAAAADTVLLADGTYTGPGNRDIDFRGKAITVRSQSGEASAVVIVCGGTSIDPHRAFLFDSNETQTSVLEGVTITDGYIDDGGAIICHYSSPTIKTCIFTGNTATTVSGAIDLLNSTAVIDCCHFISNQSLSAGGAVYMEISSPTISSCSFSWNTAANNGGALYCHGATPTLTGCLFSRNSAQRGGGVYLDGNCTASMSFCTFWKNEASQNGGGLRCDGASPTLENCTLAADSSGSGGAAIHLGPSDAPGLTNTLIAFSRTGNAITCIEPGGAIGLACCNIYGNEGGDWSDCIEAHAGVNGNFSADPKFCDIPTADLRVEACSPCMSGLNTCGVDIGAQGSGCGCGEATEPATWGTIKAMHK